MVKSHYDTLGVAETASIKEIKKAFRKLSMETHPDVAQSSNGERFKQISEAYRVLSNDRERRIYDREFKEASRFGGFDAMRQRAQQPQQPHYGGANPHAYQGTNRGFHGTLDILFRPRNLLLGLTVGVFTIATLRGMIRSDTEKEQAKRHHGKAQHVEAWKNPRTNQWETPAPWDPQYRKLQPTLHMIPRHQVRDSHR